MKWEDSVLKDKELWAIVKREEEEAAKQSAPLESWLYIPYCARLLVQTQAKISFYKGYDLGYDNAIREDSGIYNAGVKDGMKEVVEYIEGNKKEFCMFDDLFHLPNWRKKLRDWGINAE